MVGIPASSTTKTGRHDKAEILLKVTLKHQKSKSKINYNWMIGGCYIYLFNKNSKRTTQADLNQQRRCLNIYYNKT